MPRPNIDTAATTARFERVGMATAQVREIASAMAEADAEHVTKADLRLLERQVRADFQLLEQQMQTGFARIETTIAQASAQTQVRTTGIVLASVAIATAILIAAIG